MGWPVASLRCPSSLSPPWNRPGVTAMRAEFIASAASYRRSGHVGACPFWLAIRIGDWCQVDTVDRAGRQAQFTAGTFDRYDCVHLAWRTDDCIYRTCLYA